MGSLAAFPAMMERDRARQGLRECRDRPGSPSARLVADFAEVLDAEPDARRR